jgi:hypothetical protein
MHGSILEHIRERLVAFVILEVISVMVLSPSTLERGEMMNTVCNI